MMGHGSQRKERCVKRGEFQLSGGELVVSTHKYKRPLDLAILITTHVLLFPVWIVLWTLLPLLILLEDGPPVFYRQKRVGKDGHNFTVLKFRTLRKDADQIVKPWEIPARDMMMDTGRFIRKTGLDELPQVINILRGEMSFVGPRAMPVAEYREVRDDIPDLDIRFAVRPGLTGLAQVYGNGVREIEEKLKYDRQYLKHMSVLLDCKLVLLSIRNTLSARWDQAGSPT